MRKIIMALLLLGLAACGRNNVRVTAAVDPTIHPSKSEAIFVYTPDDASVAERQFLYGLSTDLTFNGFTVVPTREESRWTITGSLERRRQIVGATVFLGTASFNEFRSGAIFLYVSDSRSQNDKPRLVWEASAAAREGVYIKFRRVMVKMMLDYYGNNIDRPLHFDKAYTRKLLKDGQTLR